MLQVNLLPLNSLASWHTEDQVFLFQLTLWLLLGSHLLGWSQCHLNEDKTILRKGWNKENQKWKSISNQEKRRLTRTRNPPSVRIRSILSISLHLCKTSLIFPTSSETTAAATTFAPPNFSDEEFTTDTALGPLQFHIILQILIQNLDKKIGRIWEREERRTYHKTNVLIRNAALWQSRTRWKWWVGANTYLLQLQPNNLQQLLKIS